jgi:hypothetical protein
MGGAECLRHRAGLQPLAYRRRMKPHQRTLRVAMARGIRLPPREQATTRAQ